MDEENNIVLSLPLFQDSAYYYTVNLEGIAYKIKFYYNNREEVWAMDISYASGEPIILSNLLIPNYPMLIDHNTPFTGYFLLSPIGKEQNETISNPYEIWKYYGLYYVYTP